jgi:hypothetical protein
VYSKREEWNRLRAEYLRQVEKALSSFKGPYVKQLTEDICSHLDRRFLELGSERQTRENFQAIIADMGPASDYAELLGCDAALVTRSPFRKYLFWVALAVVVIAATAILAKTVLSQTQ